MRGRLVAVVVALTTLWAGAAAGAHDAKRFRACTVSAGSCSTVGAAFLYGDVVRIRGIVEPVHAGLEAKVLRLDPGSDAWERVATVVVSDAGRMRYVWRTRYRDAVQDAPYRFRFSIPGHGASNATEAYVLLGE